jgi:dTDP-L-rhamnose 4-epimerase
MQRPQNPQVKNVAAKDSGVVTAAAGGGTGKRVLITGGAGFIGSHVTDLLLSQNYSVRILDNLSPQVHGEVTRPTYLHPDAQLVVGDVRDAVAVERALADVDSVLHLAALVGVGQSMYDIASYTHVNDVGTAVLLEALSKRRPTKLVVASSMSVYGEGLARRADGRVVDPAERDQDQLRRNAWDLLDENGDALTPLPTPETKQPALSSVYALNKFNQERLCLIIGKAYNIPTIALRFFNVYGPRQALSNPYTGVLAIFASRLLNGRPPLVFEDGLQKRDFVHVRDVAAACLLALETTSCDGEVFNIGSGVSRSVLSIAEDLGQAINRSDIKPHVIGKYRAGDIRHCFADVRRAGERLGFVPTVQWREGLGELAEWLAGEVAIDKADLATAELVKRGLVA